MDAITTSPRHLTFMLGLPEFIPLKTLSPLSLDENQFSLNQVCIKSN